MSTILSDAPASTEPQPGVRPDSSNATPSRRAAVRHGAERVREEVATRVTPSLRRIRRRLRVGTALGWGLLVVVAVTLPLALVFGWGELLAIAALSAAALLFAIPFVIGRAMYVVGVELASSRVVVGDPAVGRVVVRNVGKRHSPSTRIELPVGRAKAEFRMPRLAPDGEHDELFQIPTQRRAVLTLGPVTSVRTDPLGLLRREVGWSEPTELFVHPRVVRLTSETTGLLRDLEGLPTRDLADDDVSFHALREYSPGDDLRYVHWKSTARTQKLMIRQFEQTRRSHLVVALPTHSEEFANEDEFELAVSMAASIGLTALRDGKTVSVVTSGGKLDAPTPTRLLDQLCAVELSAAGAGSAAVARTITTATPGASVITLISGSNIELPSLRLAALRVPSTARTVALRATVGGELSRAVIGELTVVDVPELSSLRMAMRAVAA